jgi:hypothetical protein
MRKHHCASNGAVMQPRVQSTATSGINIYMAKNRLLVCICKLLLPDPSTHSGHNCQFRGDPWQERRRLMEYDEKKQQDCRGAGNHDRRRPGEEANGGLFHFLPVDDGTKWTIKRQCILIM